jgi:hypothetical protein
MDSSCRICMPTQLRGHEFHYSRIIHGGPPLATACAVQRGAGRDAIVSQSVWPGYTHLHARATPEWSAAILGAPRQSACAAGQMQIELVVPLLDVPAQAMLADPGGAEEAGGWPGGHLL